jgi:spoIIIJ-associated protein
MENLEISARTVEEATKKALAQLSVGLDEIEITVLSEGRGGILGLGAEDARIRVKILKSKKDDNSEVIEIARNILDNLLSRMGIQATISATVPESSIDDEGALNPVTFNVTGGDSSSLIGRRGQTIDALQYLVRLITSKQNRSRTPIMVDVQDYKKRRYEDLRTLAMNVALQVKTRKTSCRLEPMSAFERRIIHITLANDPDVTTESIGEGETRKVVVMPKQKR